MDLLGPVSGAAVLVGGILPEDAELLGIYSYPLQCCESTALHGTEAIDLTGALCEDGFLRMDVPEGQGRSHNGSRPERVYPNAGRIRPGGIPVPL